MSTSPKREHIIKAIFSNDKLSEEERYSLIVDLMDEFKGNYPNLQNHATKDDIKTIELEIKRLEEKIHQTDLKIEEVKVDLSKEIHQIDLKIEEVRTDLTKEIAQVKVDLTKDIEKVRTDLTKDIEKTRTDLTKEIAEVKTTTLKWTFIFWASQMLAIGSLIYKIF